MQSDNVIWSTIGHNKFCSFKKKIVTDNFCKNKYNVSGLCRRRSCPLANSKYVTVLEEEGKMFLYVKTPERCHTPRDMWERIPLHPSFLKSLEQVNKYLEYWPHHLRKKVKQRMVKIRQYIVRMRKLRNKVQPDLVAIDHRKEKTEQKREKKAHTAAKLHDSIRTELLDRLRHGTYGELYDDIVNFNTQVYNDALDEIEDEEMDLDGDVDEFVEAYSSDEEEDLEVEYEVEHDKAGKAKIGGAKRKSAMSFDEEDIENAFDDFDSGLSDLEEEEEAPKPKVQFSKAASKKVVSKTDAKLSKKGKHVKVSFDE